MKTRVSGSFSLHIREKAKALALALLGVVCSAVIEIIKNEGTIPTTWEEVKTIVLKGLSYGILYLIITYTSNGNNPSIIEKVITSKKDTPS